VFYWSFERSPFVGPLHLFLVIKVVGSKYLFLNIVNE